MTRSVRRQEPLSPLQADDLSLWGDDTGEHRIGDAGDKVTDIRGSGKRRRGANERSVAGAFSVKIAFALVVSLFESVLLGANAAADGCVVCDAIGCVRGAPEETAELATKKSSFTFKTSDFVEMICKLGERNIASGMKGIGRFSRRDGVDKAVLAWGSGFGRP